MSEKNAREFWLTDCDDNSGWLVETKYDYKKHFGSCNVFHCREVLPGEVVLTAQQAMRIRTYVRDISSLKLENFHPTATHEQAFAFAKEVAANCMAEIVEAFGEEGEG